MRFRPLFRIVLGGTTETTATDAADAAAGGEEEEGEAVPQNSTEFLYKYGRQPTREELRDFKYFSDWFRTGAYDAR